LAPPGLKALAVWLFSAQEPGGTRQTPGVLHSWSLFLAKEPTPTLCRSLALFAKLKECELRICLDSLEQRGHMLHSANCRPYSAAAVCVVSGVVFCQRGQQQSKTPCARTATQLRPTKKPNRLYRPAPRACNLQAQLSSGRTDLAFWADDVLPRENRPCAGSWMDLRCVHSHIHALPVASHVRVS
jgi:hypothetical protein